MMCVWRMRNPSFNSKRFHPSSGQIVGKKGEKGGSDVYILAL